MSRQKATGSDDHEFWQLVFESHAKSGSSVNKFCENEGISPSSFYQWRKKLAPKSNVAVTHDKTDESTLSVEPGFIPIGQLHPDCRELCITFPSGIAVNAPNGCDVQLLRETVRTLCEQQRC
jgi:hypothetical protein